MAREQSVYLPTATHDHVISRHAAFLPVTARDPSNGSVYTHPAVEIAVTPIWRFHGDQTVPHTIPRDILDLAFESPEGTDYYAGVPSYLSQVIFSHDGKTPESKKNLLARPEIASNDVIREWVKNDWVEVITIPDTLEALKSAYYGDFMNDRDEPVSNPFRFRHFHALWDILRAGDHGRTPEGVIGWKAREPFMGQHVFRALTVRRNIQRTNAYDNTMFIIGYMPKMSDGKLKRQGRFLMFTESLWIEILMGYLRGMYPEAVGDSPTPAINKVLDELKRRGPWPGLILTQDRPTVDMPAETIAKSDTDPIVPPLDEDEPQPDA